MDPNENFLELGRLGKSAWWRYLVGFGIIFAFYLVGSIVCVVFWTLASGGRQIKVQPTTGDLLGIDPIVNFVGMHFMFAGLILGTWLVITFLHRRPFLTLITAAGKFSFPKFLFGACTWIVPFLIGHVIEFLMYPSTITCSFQMPEWFYFLPLVLLLTPMQCLSEELLFRGYLLQSFSSFVRNPWLLAVLNGFFFMLPHLLTPHLPDPFVVSALCFFTIGFFYAIVAIRSNSLEMTFGAHTANNMMSALVFNYEGSPLTTNSIFLASQMHPFLELFSTIAAGVVMLVCASKYKQRSDLSEPKATLE